MRNREVKTQLTEDDVHRLVSTRYGAPKVPPFDATLGARPNTSLVARIFRFATAAMVLVIALVVGNALRSVREVATSGNPSPAPTASSNLVHTPYVLTCASGTRPSGMPATGLRWSPDGTQLAITAVAGSDARPLGQWPRSEDLRIEIVRPGGEATEVASGTDPIWSDDGTVLGYSDLEPGDLQARAFWRHLLRIIGNCCSFKWLDRFVWRVPADRPWVDWLPCAVGT